MKWHYTCGDNIIKGKDINNIDNNELINDCHQLDLLADGSINSFDLAVLVDMVMSGQN